jgi:hypothetical protein
MKNLKTSNYKDSMKKKAQLQLETISLLVDQVVEMVSEWGDNMDSAIQEVFEGQELGPGVIQMVKREVIKNLREKGTAPPENLDTIPIDLNRDISEQGF